MEKHDLNNDFGSMAFKQLMELFIIPEIRRRKEAGKLNESFELYAAQIIFFPDGRKPLVRINSEMKAVAKIKLKSGISKKVSEPIFIHELEGLEELNLTEEDDLDCGHATLFRIGNRWIMVFDFRYNRKLSKKHIEVAKQFYEAAEFSFSRKNWSAFIDNLFSTVELLAKSILLSTPAPELRKKSSHKAIKTEFNRFTNLKNIDPVYCEIFNKLYNLRSRARYLKGDFSISEDEACKLLDIVDKMMEDIIVHVSIH